MHYCLDANVYIEAHRRYYAFDIAPGFWDGLIRLAEQQIICSPSLVYQEIMQADYEDKLARWAKVNRDSIFVEIDDTTQDAYQEIADLTSRLYEPQHVQAFLAGADPWVIAYAKAHQLSVVTMESWKNESETQGRKKSAGRFISRISANVLMCLTRTLLPCCESRKLSCINNLRQPLAAQGDVLSARDCGPAPERRGMKQNRLPKPQRLRKSRVCEGAYDFDE